MFVLRSVPQTWQERGKNKEHLGFAKEQSDRGEGEVAEGDSGSLAEQRARRAIQQLTISRGHESSAGMSAVSLKSNFTKHWKCIGVPATMGGRKG